MKPGYWMGLAVAAGLGGACQAAEFKSLYAFQGGTDGANPSSRITALNGVLYGTTSFGGTGICYRSGKPAGCGTLYSFNKLTNVERVVYAFPGTTDGSGSNGPGAEPYGGLSSLDGKLYGLAGSSACTNGSTVVYSLTVASGVE
jgi:uncharacterized repeat protein (TIGR03803 family)